MDGYQRRTEKKKNTIREAALRLFSAHGFDKVSLAEIAREAHVSPVSIYNYFGTKDGLIRHVVLTFLEEAWQDRVRLIQSDMPFEQKVEKMIFDTADTAAINPEFLHVLMSNDPEIKDMVETIYQKYLPDLLRFIDAGKKEGYIDPNISTETIVMYFNLLKEVKTTDLFREVTANPRMLEELTRLFFYGLLNKDKK
ncbi:TetR/AcrR family transcriptional regulator [Desmospora profundinema]|uniref:AcrR family transcriptional regulator n=1 Tax=Desmospora profundinema TaxID=1571184 RepID=A0ABU1II76_9BACL|nr:TetR/AcrR family transcriptional regulator [Desmospora profundinema]MDR6224471.1 AcrR family transcriptional regulator [Desmospora profundinema]